MFAHMCLVAPEFTTHLLTLVIKFFCEMTTTIVSSPWAIFALGELLFLALCLHWGAWWPGFPPTMQFPFFLKMGLDPLGQEFQKLFFLLWPGLFSYLFGAGFSSTMLFFVDNALTLAVAHSCLLVSSTTMCVMSSWNDIFLCLCFSCCL